MGDSAGLGNPSHRLDTMMGRGRHLYFAISPLKDPSSVIDFGLDHLSKLDGKQSQDQEPQEAIDGAHLIHLEGMCHFYKGIAFHAFLDTMISDHHVAYEIFKKELSRVSGQGCADITRVLKVNGPGFTVLDPSPPL